MSRRMGWVKCTDLRGEAVYLNVGAARMMTPLAPGLTRVTFRITEKEFVDVQETPEQLTSRASEFPSS